VDSVHDGTAEAVTAPVHAIVEALGLSLDPIRRELTPMQLIL